MYDKMKKINYTAQVHTYLRNNRMMRDVNTDKVLLSLNGIAMANGCDFFIETDTVKTAYGGNIVGGCKAKSLIGRL